MEGEEAAGPLEARGRDATRRSSRAARAKLRDDLPAPAPAPAPAPSHASSSAGEAEAPLASGGLEPPVDLSLPPPSRPRLSGK